MGVRDQSGISETDCEFIPFLHSPGEGGIKVLCKELCNPQTSNPRRRCRLFLLRKNR
jgi:hypothetical protein